MKKLIIFTDLDGTLLDHSTYSFEKALPALDLIRQKNIPLVICSSKTRKEIEHYRKKLDNLHPFVSENGGGIFIPKKYFNSPLSAASYPIEEETNYNVIRLGARYSDLRNTIEALRKEGFDVSGFGDMSAEEVSEITGMALEEARMSKERDFDEPFLYNGPSYKLSHLLKSIHDKGLKFTQGKFFHILGSSNKGKTVSILTDLYKKEYNNIQTVAIGDSPNDIPILQQVDYPVIVQKPDGSYDPGINVPGMIKAEGIGPGGWNKAMLTLLE